MFHRLSLVTFFYISPTPNYRYWPWIRSQKTWALVINSLCILEKVISNCWASVSSSIELRWCVCVGWYLGRDGLTHLKSYVRRKSLECPFKSQEVLYKYKCKYYLSLTVIATMIRNSQMFSWFKQTVKVNLASIESWISWETEGTPNCYHLFFTSFSPVSSWPRSGQVFSLLVSLIRAQFTSQQQLGLCKCSAEQGHFRSLKQLTILFNLKIKLYIIMKKLMTNESLAMSSVK